MHCLEPWNTWWIKHGFHVIDNGYLNFLPWKAVNEIFRWAMGRNQIPTVLYWIVPLTECHLALHAQIVTNNYKLGTLHIKRAFFTSYTIKQHIFAKLNILAGQLWLMGPTLDSPAIATTLSLCFANTLTIMQCIIFYRRLKFSHAALQLSVMTLNWYWTKYRSPEDIRAVCLDQ